MNRPLRLGDKLPVNLGGLEEDLILVGDVVYYATGLWAGVLLHGIIFRVPWEADW